MKIRFTRPQVILLFSVLVGLFFVASMIGAWLMLEGDTVKRLRAERRLTRAQHYIEAGDYDKAEAEYRSALSADHTNVMALGYLGDLFFREGRVLAGYGLLNQSLKNGADATDLRLDYALVCSTLGKTADARAAAQQVLEADPANAEALMLLANTSVTLQDSEAARKLVETLRSHHPDAAGYHLALGALLLMKHDDAGAEAQFHRAATLDPKSPFANEGLGNLCLQRGEVAAAGAFFKSAAALAPIRSPLRLKYIEYLTQTGSMDEAKRALDEITTKAPDFLPALVMAMNFAASQNRYDDALAGAAAILNRDPTNYDALFRRAVVKLIQGDADGAIADLKVEQTYYSRTPAVKYQLAVAYVKKGDNAEAASYLHQALVIEPAYDDAIVLLADLDIRRGDTAQAVAELTELLKRQPLDARAGVLLAHAYREQGDLDHALAVFRALAAGAPNSPTGAYWVGMALFEQNRRGEARQAFEHAVEIAPDYWPALEMLVSLDLQDRRYDTDSARVEALIKNFPGAPDPWLFRARLRLATRDLAGAEADLLKAIDLDPGSQYAYLHLAQLYLQQGAARKALPKLEAAAAQTRSVGTYMLAGMIHAQLGDFDAARQAYEQLLARDSKFVPALNNLAALYNEKLGQPEAAYRLAKSARDLAPDNPAVADTLGWILFQKGDYENALPLLRQSADQQPSESEVQYHLGMTYYRLGQPDAARRSLQAAVAVPTDSPVKADARERLAILTLDPQTAGPEVRANLEERVRQDPGDPEARMRLAAIQARAGAAEAAAANYEAVLQLTPHSVPTMLALGQIYAGALPRADRARELMKSAHELLPNDARVTWTLARILFRTKDYGWSVDLLEQAGQTLENEPGLSLDLARGYYSLGRVTDAQSTLQQLLDGVPNFPQRDTAQRLMALIADSQDPALAASSVGDARKVLASEPESVPALMVVAVSREGLQDYSGAAAYYEQILAIDPPFVPAMRQLAILYAERLGDDRKAETLALKARPSYADDPVLAYELGAIAYRKGNFPSAVNYLKQSVRDRPTDAETLFYLGMANYQLKNNSEARDDLERAMGPNLPVQESDQAKRVIDEISHGDGAVPVPEVGS